MSILIFVGDGEIFYKNLESTNPRIVTRELTELIKAVTFDLWNTIFSEIHYGGRRVRLLRNILASEGFRIEANRVKTAYSSAMKYFELAWSENWRHVDAAELIDHLLEKLGTKLPVKSRSQVVEEFESVIFDDPPCLIEGAEIMLESLSNRHKIGLVSNAGVTPGRILRIVLKRRKILNYFQSTVFSDEVGYHKPHSAIFHEALKTLEVIPEEVIHIGDMLETDVAGAKAIGMKAIWLSKGQSVGKMDPQPDYRIEGLLQLRDIRELWR
jgi:putative hydrolase of the HAD superfamily